LASEGGVRLYTDEIEMMARRAGDYMDEELLSACDLALSQSTAPDVRDALLEYIETRLIDWDEELERRAYQARCRAVPVIVDEWLRQAA
jgi:hypothetical protein